MTLPEISRDPDHQDEPAPIGRLVLLCQQSYADWSQAQATGAATAREQYRGYLEQLWDLIADDLRVVARGWIRSNMAPDIESLALNMFANIVFSLPRLQIDPERNARKFLITVARRRLIDEYRRTYAASGRRMPKLGDEPAPGSGTPAARMWQPAVSPTAELQSGTADVESYIAEERVAARLDQLALLRAIWAYWPKSLSADDLRIVTLRWQSDPPCSFRDIAQQLGPGWNEDTVRQRHHRILKATRAHLRASGLLDDEPIS
jgi:DNA-directed RNA polymerase specialized sigma24 family protein